MINIKQALYNLSLSENNNENEPNIDYYRGLIVGIVSSLMDDNYSFSEACIIVRDYLPENHIPIDDIIPDWDDSIAYTAKSHYVVMGGLRGYMPNFLDVAMTKSSCFDYIALIHDLSFSYVKKLYYTNGGYLIPLDIHKHGNEYASIDNCNCHEPYIHQDSYISEKEFRLNNPEFYE